MPALGQEQVTGPGELAGGRMVGKLEGEGPWASEVPVSVGFSVLMPAYPFGP